MKTLRFHRSQLAGAAAVRREGFAAEVEKRARVSGEFLEVDSADWHALTVRYLKAEVGAKPAEPAPAELAVNFVGAMERWAAAGFAIVSAEQYGVRAAACEACELWDGKARLGLGKCNAPACGCTKFKRWLATEQCKHPAGSRWPKLNP